MSLSGAQVVVVGGSSGIGLATASLLAEQSATVTISGRDPDRLSGAAAQVPGIRAEQVDALDRQELDALFARLGSLDHLVVCVTGRGGAGPFATLDLAALRHGFEAKTIAQLQVAQAALPYLAEAGSITLVTAASAQAAMPGTAGLAAVNGALEAAIRPLAVELAPRRVNAVSPGVIDTPWWHNRPEEERAAYFAETARQLPVGHIGDSADIAAVITMAISNPFITGHVLVADGGAHLAR